MWSEKKARRDFQPKFGVVFSPFENFPDVLLRQLRARIASQDARGIIRTRTRRKFSTTDFYQTGAAYNSKRFSIAPIFSLLTAQTSRFIFPTTLD
jgi:hypothetical protein